MCFSCSQVFLSVLVFSQQVMDRLSSSASTVPSIGDFFEHNMWNPLLELLFLEQANGTVASSLVEIDVAKIAIYCHFALDLHCYKGAFDSTQSIGHCQVWHHCHPWTSRYLNLWYLVFSPYDRESAPKWRRTCFPSGLKH